MILVAPERLAIPVLVGGMGDGSEEISGRVSHLFCRTYVSFRCGRERAEGDGDANKYGEASNLFQAKRAVPIQYVYPLFGDSG